MGTFRVCCLRDLRNPAGDTTTITSAIRPGPSIVSTSFLKWCRSCFNRWQVTWLKELRPKYNLFLRVVIVVRTILAALSLHNAHQNRFAPENKPVNREQLERMNLEAII
jgi:hypothetical protein